MTLRDMIKRFQARIDNVDKAFWNDDRITALANYVKDEIAQVMQVTDVECYYEFSSVKGQKFYQVPTNFVKHTMLYFDSSYRREIIIGTSPSIIKGKVTDETTEGIPQVGYIWHSSGRRQLHIYPTFNADGITCQWFFRGMPEDIENDADEFAFPIEWHPTILKCMLIEKNADDGNISYADKTSLYIIETSKLKRLASSVANENEKGAYGSIESNLPRQGNDVEGMFTIVGDNGVIY